MNDLRYYDRINLIAQVAREEHSTVEKVRILEVKKGNGRHIHNSDCGYIPGDRLSCLKDCDDSDLIVTLAYGCSDGISCFTNGAVFHEHQAVYGILDGNATCWMD